MTISRKIWQTMLAVMVVLMLIMATINVQPAIAGPLPAVDHSQAGDTLQKQMSQCFGSGVQPDRNQITGKINFAGSGAPQPLLQTEQLAAFPNPESAARSYLEQCGSLFGVSNQGTDLSLLSQKTAPGGRSVIRFQQNYQGIPVFGAQLLLQLTSENAVILVNGDILPIAKLKIQPEISAAAAQQAALQMVSDKHQVAVSSLKTSAAKLMIYSPSLFQEKSGIPTLVWQMEVTPRALAPIREQVLLNAHTGAISLSFNQVDFLKDRKTYTAGNTLITPGSLVCDESDPDCAAGTNAGDTDAVQAHLYAGDTYDFYFDHHTRDSIDNAGMSLISTVHYSTGYCNAFWNGFQMTYGDGCANSIVADDVVAHELTHGVTEYESGLVYIGQQGAINESLSDIWGEFVDQTNGHGLDTPAVKWVLAEEVKTGGIRNMKDPTQLYDPDRMGSPYYYNGTGDNGGVHTNSGVGNKTAYLITDGDTFNGVTITGIGISKTAAIYYEVQTNILGPTSNYRSLRDALNTACNTLKGGVDGITARDCTQVDNATLATELDLGLLPAPAPANDNIAAPVVMSFARHYHKNQNVINATMAGDDPDFPGKGYHGSNTVWYKYNPPVGGYLALDTMGSNYDTLLSLWSGTPGNLTVVGYNDDIGSNVGNYQSAVRAFVSPLMTYYIEVAGWYGQAENLELNASFTPYTTSDFRKSEGPKDGWVLEATENSGMGGTINASQITFNLGDDNLDRQYRAILSFDSALPAGAVITKATLKIKQPATNFKVGNNNPFTWGGGLKIDVCQKKFGTLPGMQKSDFEYFDAASCLLKVGTFGTTPDAFWYSAPLSAAGIAKINTAGLTQFRLYFANDDNDDMSADYLKFYSGDSGVSSPRLVIEYNYP